MVTLLTVPPQLSVYVVVVCGATDTVPEDKPPVEKSLLVQDETPYAYQLMSAVLPCGIEVGDALKVMYVLPEDGTNVGDGTGAGAVPDVPILLR
jgi:hypothetical protein